MRIYYAVQTLLLLTISKGNLSIHKKTHKHICTLGHDTEVR